MDQRKKILQAFKSTLDNIDKRDLLAIINEIDGLDVDGISLKDYLTTFNSHYDFLPFESNIKCDDELILGDELFASFYSSSRGAIPDYIFSGDPPKSEIRIKIHSSPPNERVFC